jgi:hypothetical protein
MRAQSGSNVEGDGWGVQLQGFHACCSINHAEDAMEGFGVRNFSSFMSLVVYGWKFLEKRRSSPSLDHTVGPSVSNFAYITIPLF